MQYVLSFSFIFYCAGMFFFSSCPFRQGYAFDAGPEFPCSVISHREQDHLTMHNKGVVQWGMNNLALL